MFQTEVVEKIKTHILGPITFFFATNCATYNVEKCGRAREASNADIIQTCTQNMQYILLFSSDVGFANVPQHYVYKCFACLFTNCSCIGLT
jgi:hypothetical protein